jgi:hypothetical protein
MTPGALGKLSMSFCLLGSMDLIVTAGQERLYFFPFPLTYSPNKISVDARKAIMTTIQPFVKTKQSQVMLCNHQIIPR